MVQFGADREFGHNADILKNIVSLCSMGLYLGKLVIFKSAVLVKDFAPDADLADVMEQRDVVVFLNSLFVKAHLLSKHLSIVGNSCRVTPRIFVLHVDSFRERLNDLSDERLILFLLLQQRLRLLVNVEINGNRRSADNDNKQKDVEPQHVKYGSLLNDCYRELIVAVSHGIGKGHLESIVSALKVRIID